jgi:hypothetical protein
MKFKREYGLRMVALRLAVLAIHFKQALPCPAQWRYDPMRCEEFGLNDAPGCIGDRRSQADRCRDSAALCCRRLACGHSL